MGRGRCFSRRCLSLSVFGLSQACLPGSNFTPETRLDPEDAERPLLVISQVLSSPTQLRSCPSLPLCSPAATGAFALWKAVSGAPSASSPTPLLPRGAAAPPGLQRGPGRPDRPRAAPSPALRGASQCRTPIRPQGSLPRQGPCWMPGTPLSLDQRICPSTSEQILPMFSD